MLFFLDTDHDERLLQLLQLLQLSPSKGAGGHRQPGGADGRVRGGHCWHVVSEWAKLVSALKGIVIVHLAMKFVVGAGVGGLWLGGMQCKTESLVLV